MRLFLKFDGSRFVGYLTKIDISWDWWITDRQIIEYLLWVLVQTDFTIKRLEKVMVIEIRQCKPDPNRQSSVGLIC